MSHSSSEGSAVAVRVGTAWGTFGTKIPLLLDSGISDPGVGAGAGAGGLFAAGRFRGERLTGSIGTLGSGVGVLAGGPLGRGFVRVVGRRVGVEVGITTPRGTGRVERTVRRGLGARGGAISVIPDPPDGGLTTRTVGRVTDPPGDPPRPGGVPSGGRRVTRSRALLLAAVILIPRNVCIRASLDPPQVAVNLSS